MIDLIQTLDPFTGYGFIKIHGVYWSRWIFCFKLVVS